MLLTVVLSGLFMLIFGLLKWGKLVRYISYSVMTGFLYGIAVLTILSQLPTIFDISAQGTNKVLQTLDLLTQLGATNLKALFIGTLTLVLLLSLSKTFIGKASALVSVAIPSLLVLFLNWENVDVVQDISEIPTGFPEFMIPDLSLLSPTLITGALSLAAVVLIQSAGVSQSVPNPDGSMGDDSRNFIGQGATNMASGLFGGIAIGGSLGSTALNVMTGAKTRLASIVVGCSILLFVLIFPGLLAQIAMPVLAMIMVYASAGVIKMQELRQIMYISWGTRILMIVTFAATLILQVQLAILFGILLSGIVYFYSSSKKTTLVGLKIRDDSRFQEIAVPEALESERIYIIEISGPLHFAAARTIEDKLPKIPKHIHKPIVILRLKDRDGVAATFVEVLENYAKKLGEVDGEIYLSGLSIEVSKTTQKMQDNEIIKHAKLFEENDIRGDSTILAFQEAIQKLRGC